ncbi:hypothetical protein NDU88_000132 [Pleurodeles waltl]|uniref:Uncharacterized protein n=1 Tax=Pleurodeles waltl TaxID=8319 RepID=A0AAV7VWP1_PLEWA|nr:hypothetical protein NDU88_000131 [Pleurodeles waltl]KAJ1204693.1 hypothetical protein NDU88_000132 [Pleurodeles waltl]
MMAQLQCTVPPREEVTVQGSPQVTELDVKEGPGRGNKRHLARRHTALIKRRIIASVTAPIITKSEPSTRGWWPDYRDRRPLRDPVCCSRRKCTPLHPEEKAIRAMRSLVTIIRNKVHTEAPRRRKRKKCDHPVLTGNLTMDQAQKQGRSRVTKTQRYAQ